MHGPTSSPPPRSTALRRLAPAGLCALALAGCVRPVIDDGPPPALHAALAAPDHVGARAAAPDDGHALDVLTFDLRPFVEAGLPEVPGTIRSMLGQLAVWDAPHSFHFAGDHLVARHRPEELRLVRLLLEGLVREKLRPIELDVHLVEIDAAALRELTPAAAAAFAGLASDTSARSVARRHLRLVNGQWSTAADGRSVRPVTAIALHGDRPEPVQQTRRDGLTLNAAVWRRTRSSRDPSAPGAEAAVLHLEAALQLEVEEPQQLPVRFQPKDRDPVEVAIDLPTLQTIAIRGQVQVDRGAWSLIGSAPATAEGRSLVALARASWKVAQPIDLASALPGNRQLRVVSVALPEAKRPEVAQGFAWGKSQSSSMRGGKGVSFSGFDFAEANGAYELENQRQVQYRGQISNQVGQVGQVYAGLGRNAAQSARASVAPTWQPLLPVELEARRQALGEAKWDRTTAMFFEWDQLFVIQSASVAEQTESLFEAVQTWKNEPVQVRAEWLEVPAALAAKVAAGSALTEDDLTALREGALLPAFDLTGRSGAWSEVSANTNHTVLWGYLGADRPSPALRLLPHGASFSVLPRRYGDGRVEVDVRFLRDEVDPASLTAEPRGAGFVHAPRFTRAEVQDVLQVAAGEPTLLFEASSGDGSGSVRALLVTAWF